MCDLLLGFGFLVPGPPSGVYFPEVTHSTARIAWSPPLEPGGIITGYRVEYVEKGNPPTYAKKKDNISPGEFAYYVTNLQRTRYYTFTVQAKTKKGWGQPEIVDAYTVINRSK